MTIEELLRLVNEFRDKMVGHGADAAEISAAELRLGVVFPPSYRAFLENLGWGRFSSEMVFGLGSDVPPHLDLVRITLSERTDVYPSIPEHLIPLMNDGAGNHYCLDTGGITGRENPVVFWDHELGADQEVEPIAPSFSEWFGSVLARLSNPDET